MKGKQTEMKTKEQKEMRSEPQGGDLSSLSKVSQGIHCRPILFSN